MNTNWRRGILKAAKGLAMTGFLVGTLLPLFWLVMTSFKLQEKNGVQGLTIWPRHFTLGNYVTAFTDTHFGVFILNSAYVTIASSVIVVIISVMGGYALSRYDFKGKRAIMLIFLVSQMMPLVVAIIPMFVLFSKLHLIDSLFSLIISYTVSNIPFCLITMAAFFKRIPISLEEAAMIDGCSRRQAVVRVVLPVMLPGIMAVFTFAFTGCWNELYYAIMMINSEGLRTIPAGLMNFIQKYNVDWGQMTAAATVTLLPAAVMFLLSQKHIVAGMTAGAVKE